MQKLKSWAAIMTIASILAGHALPVFALGDITPPVVDLCPNIDGAQASIPTGMIVDGSGNCVAADTTPPVISAVVQTGVTTIAANVTWLTNELSVSTFEYGTSTSYGSSASISGTAAIGGTAVLTGLIAGTTYYFCIHATDTSSNTPSSCSSFSTSAPIVVPPVISVVAVSSVATTSAIVTWTTDTNSDTQVNYGTTSSYGSSSTLNSTLGLTHSVTLSNLSANTLYHYQVQSRDSSGNLTTSSDATFTTNAIIASDTTPPVISGVLETSVLTNQATVVWTTNELATSSIRWGTSTSYGHTLPINESAGLAHTGTILSLSPSTAYYYCIDATDLSGNTSSSCGNFTTATAIPVENDPPVVSLITVGSIGTTSATIAWTTDEISNSQIVYGTTAGYGSQTTLDTNLTTVHSVNLSNLTANTLYHYAVKSADHDGNLTTGPDNIFTTSPVFVQTPTVTPANIVAVASFGVTSSSATVAWTTDIAATGVVNYGTTTGYGSSVSASTSGLSQTVSLSGLTPSTTYHYQVVATDAVLDVATSPDQTFTTIASTPVTPPDTTPPVISAATVGSITTTSATVTWITDTLANSQIEYGTSTSYGSSTTLDSSFGLTHSVALSGLTSSTIYHYRVKSADTSNNLVTGVDNTFTTNAVIPQGVNILSIGSSGVTSSGANVIWTTDTAATGVVQYGLTTAYGFSVNGGASSTSQTASLSNLLPSTTYHYRVQATDSSANITTSGDQTLVTEAISVPSTPPDSTPPIIAGVTVTPLDMTDATIGWTTSEPADSKISYGTTTSYGSSTTLDSSLVLTHSVMLSSLTAGTAYHYQILSKDATGNLATGSDNAFTTDSLPPQPAVISSISTRSIDTSSATIVWNTNVLSNSQVNYGVSSSFGSSTPLDATLDTIHSVTISGLAQNTNYLFNVQSEPLGVLTPSISDTGEFSTLAIVAPVIPPAVISSVSVATPSSITATITWTTSTNATTLVEYGVDTSYGQSSILDSTEVTSHTASLVSLTPSTTYHYRVTSVDANGNTIVSQDNTFTTSAAPGISVITPPTAITNLSIATKNTTSATLLWNVNSPSIDTAQTYAVYYSPSPITQNNLSSATLAQQTPIVYGDLEPDGTARNYVVAGLAAGTTYYFAIKAQYDNSDWSAISNVISTTLLSPSVVQSSGSGSSGVGGGGGIVTPATISAPTNIKASGNDSQITFNWQNPNSSDFVRTVIMEKEGSYPKSPTDGVVLYEGASETFTDLATNDSQAYYAVFSYGMSGGYSSATDVSLSTTNGSNQTLTLGVRPPVLATQYSFTDALQKGDTGIEVQHLQQILKEHPDLYPQKLVTGYFGGYTKTAIAKFQKEENLPTTGVADEKTTELLNDREVHQDHKVALDMLTSSFDSDLSYGMFSNNIEALQRFLIQEGSYKEGIISEYFGPLTENAVTIFQKKYGITPANGNVGPRTRAQIKALLAK